jgi:CheY-like chemotaxis protein
MFVVTTHRRLASYLRRVFIGLRADGMNETNSNRLGAAKHSRGEIYVVDDEPMLLELASVILEPLGYRIKTFRSPEAAINDFKAAQPRPVLVITDYAMHTMNGLDLIEACRRIRPTQKILLLSGTVGPDVFEGTSTRPDNFLAKPYQAKQLVDLVKSMLPD